ncbi:Plug domain-containing protein [Sphingomonas sp. 37zxx]|uniref:Plug domain-containing protein n=1 Tax=Sphingomonas sp. 37zxx TaxID=1550073 RepID=UPI003FA78408
MLSTAILLTAIPVTLALPLIAPVAVGETDIKTVPVIVTDIETSEAAPQQDQKTNSEAVFSTGVAKGRDRLDSATSTSALRADDIQKLGARSLADILRNIPGIRTESSTGDGNSSYTIRGLPLASGGSKYMQIEEDGLPVLEFGDFFNVASDIFIRADFNLAAIEAIRGGSASTFASKRLTEKEVG